MKKLCNFTAFILLIILVVYPATLNILKLFGLESLVVTSGSMEPVYQTGSLLLVEHVKSDDIAAGDVITFYVGKDTLVTHRVVEIDEDQKTYVTKGDANVSEDENPVGYSEILGKPVLHIPKLGYFVNFVSKPYGKAVYVLLIVVIVAFIYLEDFKSDKKQKAGKRI